MQELDLRGVPFEIRDIVGAGGGLLDLHAPPNPAQQRAPFVLTEVVPGLSPEDLADRREAGCHLGVGGLVPPPPGPRQARCVGMQARGHLLHGQREVHEPGLDRTLRHAVVLGGLRGLRERQPAVFPDRPQAGGAVGASPRENDSHGVLALILGERAEERIDGLAQTGFCWLREPQQTPLQREHGVRRDDVDVVRLCASPVLCLLNRHPCVPAEQLSEHAGMASLQVLHDDHDHARVGRHLIEEAVQGLERPGRGSDSHEETVPRYRPGRPLLSRR